MDREWLKKQHAILCSMTACTPGHEEHCGRAITERKQCKCQCGGDNHGEIRKLQIKLELYQQKEGELNE